MWRLLLILAIGCASAQTGPQFPDRRAAYIRDFATVTELDVRLARNGVTDVILYGLGPMLDRPDLAPAIARLRSRGIRVLAPVAGLDRLATLVAFARRTGVRFDGLVTEHEFWNRSDRETAFRETEALLVGMRAQLFAWGASGARVGAYLGYPTEAESARLVELVDFVYANYPVRDPALAYRHIHRGVPLRDRLARFAKARITVWPIFYASGEVDMRGALVQQGLANVEATFRAAQSADAELRDVPVSGFVYFTIESMP